MPAAPAASPPPPSRLPEHAVFLQQASQAHKVASADALRQSSPSQPSLPIIHMRSRNPSVSSPTHLDGPHEGSPSLRSSRLQHAAPFDVSPLSQTEQLVIAAQAQRPEQTPPQQPPSVPASHAGSAIPSAVATKLGTPPRTTVPSPAGQAKRLAWNGHKSEQAEPAQSASTLNVISPKQLMVATDSQMSLQSTSPTTEATPWSCLKPRRIAASSNSGASRDHSPHSAVLALDEYPWRNVKSTDSCTQRLLARLPPVLLKTFLGVRLIAWLVLLLLFGIGLGLGLYVWLYFVAVVRDLTHQRFAALCYAQARIFSIQMSTCLNIQQELANEPALFTPDTPYTSSVLQPHFAVDTLTRPYSTLHFFPMVDAAARSSFEAGRGSPILSWDATSGSLVPAPASSITGGPLAGAFFPATIRIAPDDRATGLPSGFTLPAMLDLASLPGLPAVLLSLVTSNGTAQVSHAHFVANYSQPTRADGCDPSDSLSQAAWLTSEDPNGAPQLLTHDAGYRMLMLSASWNTTSSASLRGVLLTSFDMSPFLHSLRFAPMAYRAMSADHIAQLNDANIPRTGETAIMRVETRGAHPKRMYNEENSNLVFLSQHRERSRYQDADTVSLSTVDLYSSWSISTYLNNPAAAMDWNFGCTASPQLIDHFLPLDIWRRTLTCVVGAFVFLVTFLLYVLMRWHNTIFLERQQKNASIEQMDQAIREAETARDQKTDFMAFLCHELRNPLHAVLSMSDSLQDTQLDADQAESVFTIHASSELMLAITNDILDFSKIEVRQRMTGWGETNDEWTASVPCSWCVCFFVRACARV